MINWGIYWFLVILVMVAFVMPYSADDFLRSSKKRLLFVPCTLVELKHQGLLGEAYNVFRITHLLIGD